ncbi:hypothetical protein HAT2_00406 [Candidatus Similichlamydia laticola]|uniref:Thioredoxin domain-containing protein n=2 Tax=Candidatus Similichlamydia laticola TaxID=2170265 RepID=A0A369KDE5_9BACT|nr:hypothetical protein HAT2_00406 [Candidatus Similichlamydia laticola]
MLCALALVRGVFRCGDKKVSVSRLCNYLRFLVWVVFFSLQIRPLWGTAPYFIEVPGALSYETDYTTAFRRALQDEKLIFVLFTRTRGKCSCCDQVRKIYFESPSPLAYWKKFFIFCCIEVEREPASAQSLFLKKMMTGSSKTDISVPSCVILSTTSLNHLPLLSLPRTQEEIEAYLEESILAIPGCCEGRTHPLGQ